MKIVVIILCLLLMSCHQSESKSMSNKLPKKTKVSQDPFVFFDSIFKQNTTYIAKGFDYPVGKPNANGYYNAQKFQVNDHLGDDWNGTGGGNTDLGDPIYSIGNGYVTFAKDYGGGWGQVIRILHKYKGNYYESLYAHCDTMLVKKGNFVKKGTKIGTIGNVNGMYYAHLHFEIRDDIFMDLGGGYSTNTNGYVDPTKFIKSNRK